VFNRAAVQLTQHMQGISARDADIGNRGVNDP
jgi:hypothetical protein